MAAQHGPVGMVGTGNMGGRTTRALHHQLAARGVRYLDAGMSGGAAAAERGTLTLMVGGDATARARVRPLLGTFGAHVHHMGGSGAGHVTGHTGSSRAQRPDAERKQGRWAIPSW